jgi:hypothetical protein
MKDKDIVVWFSCGAASAVAAKLTLDNYGGGNRVRIVNNPIKEEHSDNLRFLRDVEGWLGVTIESCVNPKYPKHSIVEVFEDRKFMSGVSGAPCTLELKKKARQHWEASNHHDYLVLGFTAEEGRRAERFKQTERENLLTPLIDEGIDKEGCFNILSEAGIELPMIYKLGYPNANCIGCVKASSPTYWNLVRDTFPEVFEERAAQSERIGVKLARVKGKRVQLRDLDPNAKGQPLKGTLIECGIFCEEK